MEGNFSQDRMGKGSVAMSGIISAIAQFNKVWDEMTLPEKWATGGIVYHITSVWGNFTSIGSLAQPPLAHYLGDILNNFIAHPELFPKQDVKKETKAD